MTQLYEIIALLDEVARRGFLSEEVKSRYGDSMVQRVSFTAEERRKVREFCADNHAVLRAIDYPMASLFGEREERTASLLSMIQHMLGDDTSPEYVAQNSQKLQDAAEKFNTISVSNLEKLL